VPPTLKVFCSFFAEQKQLLLFLNWLQSTTITESQHLWLRIFVRRQSTGATHLRTSSVANYPKPDLPSTEISSAFSL
jgi:hypothetical protein